jgi:cytochrome d ubiquinol oxidase subunit I
MLSIPFPYIATTAGWMTAELGRQPWLIYGLMRTIDGVSPRVSAGNGLFTLLGFMGMYMLLGILFLFLVFREIADGPVDIFRQTESVETQNNQVLLEERSR